MTDLQGFGKCSYAIVERMGKKDINLEALQAKAEKDAANLRRVADWFLDKSRDLDDLDERVEYGRKVAILKTTADSIVAYAASNDRKGLGRILSALYDHRSSIANGIVGLVGLGAGAITIEEWMNKEPIAQCLVVLDMESGEWESLGVEIDRPLGRGRSLDRLLEDESIMNEIEATLSDDETSEDFVKSYRQQMGE